MSSEKIRITVTKLKGSSTNGIASGRTVVAHSTCGGRRAPLMSQGTSPMTAPATPTGSATVHAQRQGSPERTLRTRVASSWMSSGSVSTASFMQHSICGIDAAARSRAVRSDAASLGDVAKAHAVGDLERKVGEPRGGVGPGPR